MRLRMPIANNYKFNFSQPVDQRRLKLHSFNARVCWFYSHALQLEEIDSEETRDISPNEWKRIRIYCHVVSNIILLYM